ncbi:MAG: MarR family transcriptional regulator, partial [Candidatus Omnitrophica bacterium]|nr:MarR family transcriptional regulator [Candidatus Omnitrophota bacterium]
LTVSNIVVFDVLRVKGSCTMSELARTLNFTMSAVTGIIDKMIKAGLVKRERSKTDRRVVEVMLLEKGKNIAMKINDERRDMTNEMFSVLTSSERDEYLRLIGKVYDSIKGDER